MDHLDLAIRKISETRSLLALVITSSESFDYVKAKSALQELQSKLRELGRVQAKLEEQNREPREDVIPFQLNRPV